MKMKKFKRGPTMVFDHGMNPGMISHLAKLAIHDCFLYKFHKKISFTKKSLSNASMKLNLQTIHVSEFDTQKLSIKFDKNTFYNTWSGYGMIAEGIDPIQIGHSKTKSKIDKILGPGYTTPGIKNIRYYPIRGIEKTVDTIIITDNLHEKVIKGYLIPHGEANTLSKYLSTKEYTPNVYYVYHPSEPTMKSIENLKKRDYIAQPHVHSVLEQSELEKNGYDSIGAHLILKEGYGWWTGTILSIDDVRNFGMKYAGPTETQVAISYLACIRWMLYHSQKGLCSPEDLPSLELIKWCKPYLGKFVSRRVSKYSDIF
jgi:homospermidine synthase